MLCSLTDLKTMLGISAEDTTQDAKLNLIIKGVSAKIEGFLGYKLGRATYTEELHNVNCRQLLQLNHFPVQSVSSVQRNGEEITDFKLIPEFTRWGRLYKGDGWTGAIWTRGFTHDVVSGAWEITVSYIAGYYLPGEMGYLEGAESSLPYDIYTAALQSCILEYNMSRENTYGLKAHSEGQISDTYGDASSGLGLSEGVKLALAKYVYYGVA